MLLISKGFAPDSILARDRIEVPVPALVGEEIFALAQEQLTKNRHHSPRRTIEPT
jgi:hypothetical protein